MSTATATKKSNQKETAKQETRKSKLTNAFGLWERKSEKGTVFYNGKFEGVKVTAFLNKKEQMKQPDITGYLGEVQKSNLFFDLWVNVSQSTGKKYCSGKTKDGRKLVGFFNEEHKPNQPLISVYFAEDEQKPEEPAAAEEQTEEDDLPF